MDAETMKCTTCHAALDEEELATVRACSHCPPQCYVCMEREGDAAEAAQTFEDWRREANR